MAQLVTLTDTVAAYESDADESDFVVEQAEQKIYQTTIVANTAEAYFATLSSVDLYLALTQLKSHLDTIINEVNARETATIDGGTF
tara:strand:- start:1019 stop:1276 length:258 start_codon:yes stop_codon:yes gene_type:complete